MSPQLQFRKAVLSDAAELQQLGLISYSQYFPLLGPQEKEKMESNLKNLELVIQLLNTATCFICVDEEKIVGMAYVLLSGNPWDVYPANWSYIRMLGVNPEYSSMGIGKSLTVKCIDYAKKNNEKIIALHTSEMMNTARHIYESVGFKILRELEPRYGKRYWLFTLNLQR